MLPRIKAVELLGHSAQGQTLPLILDCLSDAGQAETFQVKVASRRNGLTDRELACEALCTLLARAVGLHVSTPASVSLAEVVTSAIERRYAMDISGLFGAGVKWVDYLRPLVLPVDIFSEKRGRIVPNPALVQLAARTLAFDLILCNNDRTAANPNLVWDGAELLVFDFEHCLELPVADIDRGLAVQQELLPNLRASHVFGGIVSPESLRDEILVCLDLVQANASMGVGADGVPGPWKEPWANLLGYVEYLAVNRDVIIEAALANT